jgi:hypothetical protein
MTAEPSSLAQALLEAQARMPSVAKDAKNEHFHNRFVSLDALIAHTRPILNGAGLVVTQCPTTNAQGQPVLLTEIRHAASGEKLVFDTPLFLSREDMQGFGAAVTYARRYAWAAALGIASEEDTDGEVAPAKATKPAGKKLATRQQFSAMAAIVKTLNEAQMMIPAEYAGANDWGEALVQRVKANYGVESRKELTTQQASELISWLEEQEVPF